MVLAMVVVTMVVMVIPMLVMVTVVLVVVMITCSEEHDVSLHRGDTGAEIETLVGWN